MSPENAASMLAAIEAEQHRLRELLAASEMSRLAARPPNGQWSPIEHARHLVFAEQVHFGRVFPGKPAWNPLGLSPEGLSEQKQLRMLAVTAASDLNQVLEAWEVVHASARDFLKHDTEPIRQALWKNLRHMRVHISIIERLLR